MKMNLYQFQLLSRQAQIEVICNRGIYLSTHETSSFIIDRYQVDHFYVEIFYSQANQGVIINSYYSIAKDGTLLEQEKKYFKIIFLWLLKFLVNFKTTV